MAMEINSQFTQFVQFARAQMNAGHTKAIARDAGAEGPLGGRTITAATGDKVAPFWGRSEVNKNANNVARDLFRNAVINMFGGENNIPQRVKDAMLMKDYDKGKPLTARRIIAVTTAITNASAELSQKLDLELAKADAFAKGFTKSEVENMARSADFVAEVTGSTKTEAFKELATPGTKVNRLMTYGGRFMQNAQGVRDGLRLLDSFEGWFNGVKDGLNALGAKEGRTAGMNLTMLNAQKVTFSDTTLRSVERFVFEYLAHDPSANLSETDPEKLFGMDKNPATHFFGMMLNNSRTQTIAQMPHEKRAVLYKAVNLFFPLLENHDDANMKPSERGTLSSNEAVTVVARVLKNFDKVAEMEANGNLNLKDLAKLCFPELPEDSQGTVKDLVEQFDRFDTQRNKAFENGTITLGQMPVVMLLMQDTACSFEEAVEAAKGGKQPTPPQYLTASSLALSAYDGSTNAARFQLETDLGRPKNYSDVRDDTKTFLPLEDEAFKFTFKGGGTIVTNKTPQGKANITTVMDKVENICGPAHAKQASSVMMMLSQSGLGPLYGGLLAHGIYSSEHSACNFELSRNEETGDVTIRYSNPESLPLSFEWTATITVDGTVTTTPLQVTQNA